MLGGNHAAWGAASWVAVASPARFETAPLSEFLPEAFARLPEEIPLGLGLFGDSPGGVATGAMVCAGAALLPDADHRRASIAHSLPPVTAVLCATVGRAAGGHRQGTHSLVGIVVAVVLAWLVGLWVIDAGGHPIYLGAGMASILLVSLAAKALKFVPDSMRKTPWVVGIVAGAAVAALSPPDPRWFVAAVGLGVIAHLVGDLLTVGGINPFWPFRFRRPRVLRHAPVMRQIWRPSGHFSLPLVGVTGSWREWLLCVPIAAYAAMGITLSLARIVFHYFG
ncbi:metal-dependent hydrolase [Zhihengliuella somnathii]